MKSQAVTGSNYADGLLYRADGQILLYAQYYPKNHPYCFKVGRVSPSGHLKWSPATNEQNGWRIGNDVSELWRAANYRYVVSPGPGMRFEGAYQAGLLTADPSRPVWAVRTHYSQPGPSTIVTGPNGGLYVSPRYEPPVRLRQTSFDQGPWFEPRVEFAVTQYDRSVIVRRCTDGGMYVYQMRVELALHNLFEFYNGRPEAGGTLRDLTGYEDVTDFDVSPSGNTLAVAMIAPDRPVTEKKDHNYKRQLVLYRRNSAGGWTKSVSYFWDAHYVAFAQDGMTLAMAGNPYSVRGKAIESLTVIDVED